MEPTVSIAEPIGFVTGLIAFVNCDHKLGFSAAPPLNVETVSIGGAPVAAPTGPPLGPPVARNVDVVSVIDPVPAAPLDPAGPAMSAPIEMSPVGAAPI